MDYFDHIRQKELEMEANKHGATLAGEDRIRGLEKRIQELENRFNAYVRQKDED
jgi:hypothetical protein